MDSAAANLELLIGVGGGGRRRIYGQQQGSEAVAEQAAGGKGGRRGSCGPRRGRAADEGAVDHSREGRPTGEEAADHGREGRRRCGRRRCPAKGSSDGGEAWRRGGATEEDASRSISDRG